MLLQNTFGGEPESFITDQGAINIDVVRTGLYLTPSITCTETDICQMFSNSFA